MSAPTNPDLCEQSSFTSKYGHVTRGKRTVLCSFILIFFLQAYVLAVFERLNHLAHSPLTCICCCSWLNCFSTSLFPIEVSNIFIYILRHRLCLLVLLGFCNSVRCILLVSRFNLNLLQFSYKNKIALHALFRRNIPNTG